MPRKADGSSRANVVLRVLGFVIAAALKLSFAAISIAAPLLAMWIASSLAAYNGASPSWTIVAGLGAWPLLPIAWELLGRWRADRSRRPTLTGFDRFVLRSLVVGVVFNAVLMVGFPGTVFAALSTRGDWMLHGAEGPWAEHTRAAMLRAAGSLEWLHEATHPNDFAAEIDAGATQTDAPVLPSSDDGLDDALARMRPDERAPVLPQPEQQPEPPVAAGYAPGTDAWPWLPQLHPAVLAIPSESEASIAAVAAYLVAAEPDPTLRVKAIHDYVAHRVAYDVASYRAKQYPDQSAAAVFETRLAVCAGYANLAVAIGEAAGTEIVVVAGDSRQPGKDPTGEGHAWNAARIGDRWVLFDATWDAGGVDENGFERSYDGEFLMPPPQVFAATHFPEEARWQLLAQPMTRAEFLRQAAMRPGFYARGLELRSPGSWRVDTVGPLRIELANPLQLDVEASVVRGEHEQVGRCTAIAGALECPFPAPGRYAVRLWHVGEYLGELQVDAGIAG